MATEDPFGLVNTTLKLDSRYRIDAVVGGGGFGTVYKGQQLVFDEPVAIKVLRYGDHAPSQAEQIFSSFRNEGKILRALAKESDAFVRVLDMGTTHVKGGGVMPYIVMEWLDGQTLGDDLYNRQQQGLKGRTLAEVVQILEPIAEALEVAHAQEQRIAHRDIKPDNIFLARTATGTKTKLLDFGIAKVMTDTGTIAHRKVTQVGLRGTATPHYFAPEQAFQARYGASGPWTDVYALALVCVEMLTDREPLVGDDPMALALSTTDEKFRPTPRNRGASVSAGIDAIFAKALAIQPRERYQNAKAFWDALVKQGVKEGILPRPGHVGVTPEFSPGKTEELVQAKTSKRDVIGTSIRNTNVFAVIVVMGMSIVGLFAFFAGRVSREPPETTTPEAAPSTTIDSAMEPDPADSIPPTIPSAALIEIDVGDEEEPSNPDAGSQGNAPPSSGSRKQPTKTQSPLPPGINRGEVIVALKTAASRARANCKGQSGLSGSTKVRVTYNPNGTVKSTAIQPPFLGTSVGRCITGSFHGANVPAFEGNPVTVTKTVTIEPSGG